MGGPHTDAARAARALQDTPVFVANTVGVLLGGTIFGGFFLLTLYMQTVLGYSPLEAGLAFLATAGMTIPGAGSRKPSSRARA